MTTRHPIADLLTPEQRDTILSARYYRRRDGSIRTRRVAGQRGMCCPFGVLLEQQVPLLDAIYRELGIGLHDETGRQIVRSFVRLMDWGDGVQPDDLPVLLGATPLAGERA